MKRIDQFLLKSFVGPFAAILLVVIFILMMQFLWLYIDELVGKGLSFRIIMEFMGWGSITLLPMALPLATLLASMMTLGSMGEKYELLAMKAAGISLARILVPIMITSFFISVAALFIADRLIPIAYNNIYTLRSDIGKTKEEIKIPTRTFYDGIEGYILRVDERNEETGMMYGVMVYNHSGTRGNVNLTLADSAVMKMTEDKKALSFTLFSGQNYEETNTYSRKDTTRALQSIEFSNQSIIIPLENYGFQKSEETKFDDEVKSMNLEMLYERQDSIGGLSAETRSSQLLQLYEHKSLRWNSQLDTSKVQRAKENFDYSRLPELTDLDDKIRIREKALGNVNDYISTLTTFSRESHKYTFLLRRINVEILKKYAGALACFIFFFIGAPLGALIRKGGLGTPAIISVLFFVLYWVIDISGTKLANDGALSPGAGVFISSYILFPLGIFLTYKAINDSAIINADKMKDLIKLIKNVILGRLKKTRIVFMGTPEFAVASLDALVRNKYNVVGVVTVADKSSGRGLKVNESAVKKYAAEHGLPLLQPISLKDPEFLEALSAWKPDLFVVVAFRILPRVVWEMPRLGTFNLHAALLPQYRGAAPINWAVINGDKVTGVTTFMINEGMDTGHIIFREQVMIEENDNAGTVHDKLMELGSSLVVQTVDAIIDKNYELRLQKSFIQGSEVLRPAPKLTRELCHLDFSRTTEELHNLVRGLSPYPAAFAYIGKQGDEVTGKQGASDVALASSAQGAESLQLKIFETEKLSGMAYNEVLWGLGLNEAAPGTILSDGKTFVAIATADGALKLKSVQLQGKKRMDIKAFLLGFREISSYSIG